MVKRFFIANRQALLYGVSLAGLLLLLRWLELRFVIFEHGMEFYVGAIALIFTVLGIWLALKLAKPKTIVVEKAVYVSAAAGFVLDEAVVSELGLSKRELEVLALLSEGCTNREIADRLFVSVNTVKTHTSRLFDKLGVNRRTQAVEKGKRMRLIP